MKLKLTYTFFVLCAAVFFYSSCKKAAVNTPKTDGIDYKALSSQVATTFYKSITGKYGAIDVSKGVSSPFKTNASHGGLTTYSVAPLCGFVIDTSYSYQEVFKASNPIGDTIKDYSENFHFVYTCDAGVVNGYKVDTKAFYQEKSYGYVFNDTLSQNYTVKALDETYKLVSMDGSIAADQRQNFIFGEYGNLFTSTYTLTGLKVKITSGVADVIAGTATFHIKAVQITQLPRQYWKHSEYDGTIVYLGDHKAKLTINPDHVYIVDLLTGVATPV
jgi:hypothetical protein